MKKPTLENAVHAEQTALLYQNGPFALVAVAVIAPLLTTLLWQHVDKFWLGSWLVAQTALLTARVVLLRAYGRAQISPDEAELWRRRFLVGVLVSGILWGCMGLLVSASENPTHWYLVLFVLSGLAGGAVAQLSSDRVAYASFVLPALSPAALIKLGEGTPMAIAMGGMILLFVVLTSLIARRVHRFIIQTIATRFENVDLVRQLGQTNELLGEVFDTTYVLYAQLDRDCNFVHVNKAYADAGGHPPEYFPGKNHFALYPDAENEAVFRQVVETGEPFSVLAKPFEYPDMPERGITYWDWALQPIKADDGSVDGLLLSLVDVTQQKRAQLALEEKEEYLRSVMDTAVDAIVTIRANGIVELANPAVESIFGYKPEEVMGQDIGMLMPDKFRQIHAAFVSHYISTRQPRVMGRKLETEGQRRDGSTFPLEVTISEAWVQGQRIFTGVMRDISDEKALLESLQRKNQELEYLSAHDALTGLYNRRFADEYLEKEWARACRSSARVSVILIDVDYFKAYNDNYGHQAGDVCLQSVAQAMRRHVNRPADILARYGGEEFIAILPETDSQGACCVAEKLCRAVEELAITHAKSAAAAVVTISAGVSAATPLRDSRFEPLISAADEALYQAKQDGRNRSHCRGSPQEYRVQA